MRKLMVVGLLAAACGGGAKQQAADTATAVSQTAAEAAPAGAVLEPRSGSSVRGMVTIRPMGDGVHVEARVEGATPGKHGFHFHEVGDCSAPDASSAGGHWNPSGVAHGAPTAEPHHAGDLGNIDVAADGTGTLSMHLAGLTLTPGDMSVIGKAVIFHEKEDDLVSQPTGDAGGRLACGVVVETP